jgi:uncharacterized protein
MPTDLHDAIERHDAKRVIALLAAGADTNAAQLEWSKFTPLQAAVNELEDGGPLEIVRLLLAHGAEVDGWDAGRESTPLLMSLFRNQPEAARLLLEAGADPNVRGAEGDTPLRWCVERGDTDMVELLLEKGAAKTIDDIGEPRGLTALGIACERLNVPMMRRLIEAGANPEARDYDYMTALERLPPRTSLNAEERAAALEVLAHAGGA